MSDPLTDPNYMANRASNACIYTTYAVCLVFGLAVAWWARNQPYTNSNGTRRWLPLSMNFVASGMGCGILLTYPQIAAFAGLHGLLVYALCGAIPFIMFATLGPIIRRKTPKGFVLTEWIRQRYGILTAWLVSGFTILTLYLFTVSELTSIKYAIETMTGLDGLPAMIVECVVAGIYTSIGGFQTSFITDNVQGIMVVILVIICSIAMGVTVDIDKSAVGPSGLLKPNLLGWKLIYILFVAIMTNDCFMAGFWLRTFASRTNKDLMLGCLVGGFLLFAISTVVGIPGLLAVWSHIIDPESETFESDSSIAFFLVLLELPRWVHGFVLVFVTMLSTCTIDSLQSAMASTVSNDFFRNKVRMVYVRLFVLAMMAPSIVVALRAPNVLNIYLICDILSAVVVPVMFLGLNHLFYWLTGFEIIMAVIGGILGVFFFGLVFYHGDTSSAGGLLLLEQGLYGDDWAAFGTFVAAPVCSVIGAAIGLFLRGVFFAIRTHRLFYIFEKPEEPKQHTIVAEFLESSEGGFFGDQPWYERYNLGPWAKKVDYWVFVQPEDEEDKPNGWFIGGVPWYEKFNLGPWAKKVDHFVFQKRAPVGGNDGTVTSNRSDITEDSEQHPIDKK